jgi:hypothetical protein
MKKYRFFYHYFKQKKKMSIHFRDTCTVVDNVVCNVRCETKWRKTQPMLVMQGYATNVRIENGIGYIE